MSKSPSRAESPKQTVSRATYYINGIKIILAFLLAGFILSKTDFEQVRDVVGGMSLPWLAGYFFLFILSTLAKTLQYRIVIGESVAFSRVLNVVVVQNIASNFLAATAGIASYVTLFRVEHGVKVSRALIAFLLTKIGDVIAIFLLLVISMGFVWPRIGILQWLSFVLSVSMALFILVFALLLLYREGFFDLLQRFLKWAHVAQFSIVRKVMDVVETVSQQDRDFILLKLRGVLIGSFLYMAITLAWLYAGLRIFDIRLGIWEVAYSSALFYLITYVPIQIFGGLGVTDTTMMFVYSLFGPSQAEMAAVMIGLRLLIYLMNLSMLVYLPVYVALYKPTDIRN